MGNCEYFYVDKDYKIDLGKDKIHLDKLDMDVYITGKKQNDVIIVNQVDAKHTICDPLTETIDPGICSSYGPLKFSDLTVSADGKHSMIGFASGETVKVPSDITLTNVLIFNFMKNEKHPDANCPKIDGDIILGKDHAQVLTGTDKSDIIVSYLGNDALYGGKGDDVFIFDANSGGDHKVVSDFSVNHDFIGFYNSQEVSFSNLHIKSDWIDGTIITTDKGTEIWLPTVDKDALDASNFINVSGDFADVHWG